VITAEGKANAARIAAQGSTSPNAKVIVDSGDAQILVD
jgi:hypothetical protein